MSSISIVTRSNTAAGAIHGQRRQLDIFRQARWCTPFEAFPAPLAQAAELLHDRGKRLRARLDADFKTTLPRFDVLAALERRAQGLKMSELSESLMVSNGNVTGVVARLIEDGLVTRTVDQEDRRSATVRLTRKGREAFSAMAAAHERWVDEMFADLSGAQCEELMRLLTNLRHSIESHPV